MHIKKPLLVAGMASTITLGGLMAGGLASAATDDSSSNNPMSSLVSAIATKFHLNKSDVQAVFDAQHQQMEQQHQQKVTEELNQLVTDGKLSNAQKDLIVAKQAEVKTFMESLKDKSDSDRQAAMKTERTQLETWAKTNNIPTADLRFVLPRGPGGHGGPGGPGAMDGQTPPTDSQNAAN